MASPRPDALPTWSPSPCRRGLAWAVACLFLATLPAWADPDTSWRMDRHDPRRTNFSTGTSHLAKPAIRWRTPVEAGVSVGVPADVDLDGVDDVILVVGGRLAARSLSGTVLWKTPVLGALSAALSADLDNDGVQEVVAIGKRGVSLLNFKTGNVKWSSPAGLIKAAVTWRLADFSGDGVVDLLVADSGSSIGLSVPTAFIWTFVGGTPKQLVTTEIPTSSGSFKNAFGQTPLDVDGDGVADVLLVETVTFAALSGKSGKILGVSPPLDFASPFMTAVVQVPAGPGEAPLLVWAGDNGTGSSYQRQVGWHVLQLSDGSLKERWSVQAADIASESIRLSPATIGDLDGDGQSELLDSHFINGAWRLEAWDLPTGQTLAVGDAAIAQPQSGSPGWVLRGAFRHAGQTVLVCAQQPDRLDPAVTPIQLMGWSRAKGYFLLANLGSGVWWHGNRAPDKDSKSGWDWPLRPLIGLDDGKSSETDSEVLVRRDLDGDLRIDAVERVGLLGPGGQKVTSLGTFPLSPGSKLMGLAHGKGLNLLIVTSDGRVGAWGPNQTLTNDANGDGLADLQQRAGGPVQVSVAPRAPQQAPILAVTTGSRVLVLDPFGAGPAVPPKELWSKSPADAGVVARLADTDGDGLQEVVVRSRPANANAHVAGHDLQGKPLWAWTWPGSPVSWALNNIDPWWSADLDGDGAEEIFLNVLPQVASASPIRLSTVLSGKTHLPQWSELAACATATDFVGGLDQTVSPPRILQSGYLIRRSCLAMTGDLILQKTLYTATYGVPMLGDLNGSPPLDMVLGASAIEEEADDGATLEAIWHKPNTALQHAPAALPLVDGQPLSLQIFPSSSQLTARDAKTGTLLWSRIYLGGQALLPEEATANTASISGLATVADLTGANQPAGVFVSSDGLLYAVSLYDGAMLWTYDFGGVPDRPIPADVDGDGLLEILIATPDGELAALDSDVATPPVWVREHGPAGPALSADEDLDQQEEASLIRVNWATVSSATGYAVRLVDETGAEIAPAGLAVGSDLTISGLHLQFGHTYRVAVASHASSGADASYSTETLSDGIQLADLSPPWLEGLGCAPSCDVALGMQVTVYGKALDRTRLGAVHAVVDAGTPASQGKTWPDQTAEVALEWPLPQLDVGVHTVNLDAVDLAGHASTAQLQIRVCAPAGVAGEPKCAEAPAQPDAGPSSTPPSGASKVDVYGSQVSGCEARSAPRGGLPGWGWLLPVGLLGAVWSLRRPS